MAMSTEGQTPDATIHTRITSRELTVRVDNAVELVMSEPLSDAEIKERDQFRCARCGYGGNIDVHHRMPRSGGRDESAANRVGLCRQCHRWAHANPRAAQDEGWVVSRSTDPAQVPVGHFAWPAGPVLLLQDGGIQIWIPDLLPSHN